MSPVMEPALNASPAPPSDPAPSAADAERGTAPFASALVIDDHPLFCEALTIMLREMGVARIETADRLAKAYARLQSGPAPEVILLDLTLPDVEGMDGLLRVRRLARDTPVVVISSLEENRIVGSALRSGAAGFVPKHSPRDVFARAFAAIAGGEVFRPDGFVAGDDAPDETEQAIERLALLTPQQARILELVCEGQLNKQIAWELDIAETTVKAHITAILRKLNVRSRTQAVLLAQNARYRKILHDASGAT